MKWMVVGVSHGALRVPHTYASSAAAETSAVAEIFAVAEISAVADDRSGGEKPGLGRSDCPDVSVETASGVGGPGSGTPVQPASIRIPIAAMPQPAIAIAMPFPTVIPP
ncbi:hypothetical protein [Actinophytocola sp.]|uniref:hypothetical protein n=1 Tax=Actinophytocola sp. TaxID=1872138 RepID=UPI002ECFE981